MQTDWLEVDCSLFPQGLGGWPFVPWSDVASVVETWRSQARFERFFFVRKQPGLRLRFSGPRIAESLEPVLVQWLERAEQRNWLRSFRFATYEPEEFLFGGQAGMDIGHLHFDGDTRLALGYEALETPDLSRADLSLLVMNDLYLRFAEDRGEVWDIWKRIWAGHGRPGLPDPDPVAVSRCHELLNCANWQEHLAVPTHDLMDHARTHNADVALRLHAADRARRLDCGPRAFLAALCTFHWNRLGLELSDRLPLLATALQVFDPYDDRA
jgi:thiopeptide-type bacteriocin biosynthesis protein